MKPIFQNYTLRVVSPSPAANPSPSGWLRTRVALPCMEGREGLSTAHVHHRPGREGLAARLGFSLLLQEHQLQCIAYSQGQMDE